MEHRAGRRGDLEVTAEDARSIAGLLRYATSLRRSSGSSARKASPLVAATHPSLSHQIFLSFPRHYVLSRLMHIAASRTDSGPLRVRAYAGFRIQPTEKS